MATETAAEIKAALSKEIQGLLPDFEAAVEALCRLSKADVGELRHMSSPSEGVLKVCQAMCILFDVASKPGGASADGKDDFIEAAKTELFANPRLLDNMLKYDKENVAQSTFSALRAILEDPVCEPERLRQISLAAAAMSQWVSAVARYGENAEGRLRMRSLLNEVEAAESEAARVMEEELEAERKKNEILFELSLCMLSGDAILTLCEASSLWTRREVNARLRDHGHIAPAGHYYAFVCGEDTFAGGRTLLEIGLPRVLYLTAAPNTALPRLEAARDELVKGDHREWRELAALGRPPAWLLLLCDALCKLFGIPHDDTSEDLWRISVQQMFSQVGANTFIQQRVLSYDPDEKPYSDLAILEEFIKNPKFAVDMIAKMSGAAARPASWCHALAAYSRVALGDTDGEEHES